MEFSTHTRTSPLPVCHLLDDLSDTATKHGIYTVFKLKYPYKSSQFEHLLNLYFFHNGQGEVPRAHKELLNQDNFGKDWTQSQVFWLYMGSVWYFNEGAHSQ